MTLDGKFTEYDALNSLPFHAEALRNPDSPYVVIVDNELDALAFIESGRENVIALPWVQGYELNLNDKVKRLLHRRNLVFAMTYTERGRRCLSNLEKVFKPKSIILVRPGYTTHFEAFVFDGIDAILSALNGSDSVIASLFGIDVFLD